MFDEYVKRLSADVYRQTDPSLHNALLTAFGVHARNLLDFFYPPKALKPDDMISNDYYDNPSDWELQRPPMTEALKELREQVNKLNAHLTYQRIEWGNEKKWWKWTQAHQDLQTVLNTFLKSVPPQRIQAC
jgi:hypothetical protein